MPTSCKQADGDVGCCDSQGYLWFCDSGELVQGTCKKGYVCTWSAEYQGYGCFSPPVASAPGDNPPILCMGH